jgi:hypothetical protein
MIDCGPERGHELAQVGPVRQKGVCRASPYISEVDQESVKRGFHMGVAWTGQAL